MAAANVTGVRIARRAAGSFAATKHRCLGREMKVLLRNNSLLRLFGLLSRGDTACVLLLCLAL